MTLYVQLVNKFLYPGNCYCQVFLAKFDVNLLFLDSFQRLRLIEIYDVKRLQMRYATSLIGSVIFNIFSQFTTHYFR